MLIQVSQAQDGLFDVVVFLHNPLDDLYDRLSFAGRFPERGRAQRFADRVRARLETAFGSMNALDTSRWLWTPNPNAAHPLLRTPPVARAHVL